MSFEVVKRGTWAPVDPLREGVVSIGRTGELTVRTKDLESAGITTAAVVMGCRDTFRLALRAATPSEGDIAMRVCIVARGKSRSDSGRRRISVKRVLDLLNLTAEKVAGRYTLMSQGKNSDGGIELLIVPLMPDTHKASTKAKGVKPSGS